MNMKTPTIDKSFSARQRMDAFAEDIVTLTAQLENAMRIVKDSAAAVEQAEADLKEEQAAIEDRLDVTLRDYVKHGTTQKLGERISDVEQVGIEKREELSRRTDQRFDGINNVIDGIRRREDGTDKQIRALWKYNFPWRWQFWKKLST